MNKRTVEVSLQTAKEWYKSGNADLKEIALQAFTEEELTSCSFSEIKTFEDAVKALGLSEYSTAFDLMSINTMSGITPDIKNHLKAIYKLDIIRKALNKGWNPKMTNDNVYYSYIKFYPSDKAEDVAKSNGWETKETFNADNQKYTLTGEGYIISSRGLGSFGSECGYILPSLSLLSCESEEIAEHMSRYFSKEIFEATYAQHADAYKWV